MLLAMFCLVDEGNYEVIALRLLQRRLHLEDLYWHPTISLSISFELERHTRRIEECSDCQRLACASYRYSQLSRSEYFY